MALDSIIPPNGEKVFSDQSLTAIQEEIGYWNAGDMKVFQSREASGFPIPVKIYRQDGKKWKDFGQSLVDRGLADFGDVNFSNPVYKLHARGIEAA